MGKWVTVGTVGDSGGQGHATTYVSATSAARRINKPPRAERQLCGLWTLMLLLIRRVACCFLFRFNSTICSSSDYDLSPDSCSVLVFAH